MMVVLEEAVTVLHLIITELHTISFYWSRSEVDSFSYHLWVVVSTSYNDHNRADFLDGVAMYVLILVDECESRLFWHSLSSTARW